MNQQFSGLHHVSALSADIARNHDFYTRLLGLRLVKKTVNQDAPSMYHLFYADGTGSPGSDMTFFDFPRAAREHRGKDSISLTTFRVTGEAALNFWQERLEHGGVPVVRREVDGRERLEFEDVDSTRLAIFDDAGAGPRGAPWAGSDVPAEFQLQGLGFSGFTVGELEPLSEFLQGGLNMRPARQYDDNGHAVHVFEMGAGGPSAELHVTLAPELPRHRPGAGGVHHVALRVRDEAELLNWLAHLNRLGSPNSGEVDRHWFQSVYITAPAGLIIELATDGPGFATDEAPDSLGERLSLPPFLEAHRAEIEAKVRPLSGS
ncbi:ring-cleaving dioxygenase [Deinococcus cavernae]|uniref:Ring-cleaving dioxygenase n=1 Tax=Deinococcus cavernae TaxID=2320857 RepID=A0A418UZM5_9DEIO|nr:VOC family protein [Deinococcus cavernae]RJF68927.1 ring-cleaving dioxygenase [Deinococcus cavernae]